MRHIQPQARGEGQAAIPPEGDASADGKPVEQAQFGSEAHFGRARDPEAIAVAELQLAGERERIPRVEGRREAEVSRKGDLSWALLTPGFLDSVPGDGAEISGRSRGIHDRERLHLQRIGDEVPLAPGHDPDVAENSPPAKAIAQSAGNAQVGGDAVPARGPLGLQPGVGRIPPGGVHGKQGPLGLPNTAVGQPAKVT
ncbi:hypothetical protein D3C87_1511240 [compost metagenome]